MMMQDIRELYQEVVIEHGRHPRNFGELPNCNCQAKGVNPLCGDKLTVYLIVENETIQDIRFEGVGCAISMASASLMTEAVKSKSIQEVLSLFACFHANLVDEHVTDAHALGKLEVLLGVKAYPMRVKCATLAWHALNNALSNEQTVASTE